MAPAELHPPLTLATWAEGETRAEAGGELLLNCGGEQAASVVSAVHAAAMNIHLRTGPRMRL